MRLPRALARYSTYICRGCRLSRYVLGYVASMWTGPHTHTYCRQDTPHLGSVETIHDHSDIYQSWNQIFIYNTMHAIMVRKNVRLYAPRHRTKSPMFPAVPSLPLSHHPKNKQNTCSTCSPLRMRSLARLCWHEPEPTSRVTLNHLVRTTWLLFVGNQKMCPFLRLSGVRSGNC